MAKKTIKVPFEVILRNKKTKEEIKAGELSIPVTFSVDKRLIHKTMEKVLDKEDRDEERNNETTD